jgi:excisionase family DNA binding protein
MALSIVASPKVPAKTPPPTSSEAVGAFGGPVLVSAPAAAPADPVAPHEQLLLTIPDVMAQLQLGRSTVYDLIRTRRLPSVTIGRSRRVPAAAVRTFVAELAEVAA